MNCAHKTLKEKHGQQEKELSSIKSELAKRVSNELKRTEDHMEE